MRAHAPWGNAAPPAAPTPAHVPGALAQAAAVVAVAALLAGGCANQSADPSSAPQPAATAAPTTSPGAAADAGDLEAELPELAPSPTWDAAARTQAAQVATAVMTAFTDHQASPPAWWEHLAPLLTLSAQSAYQGTDPTQVPATTLVGPATPPADPDPAIGQSSAYLARVSVPTDVGAYTVLLSRTGQGAPWLAERITPPPALATPVAP